MAEPKSGNRSSPLKFCSSRLKQISRGLEFASTRFIATLALVVVSKSDAMEKTDFYIFIYPSLPSSTYSISLSDLEFRSISARLSVEPCGSRPRYVPVTRC